VLFTHPGAELYGADRMALETVTALHAAGHRVHVVLPSGGQLERELDEREVPHDLVAVPVLRKSLMRPDRLCLLLLHSLVGLARAVRVIRRLDAELVYANTVTQPVWLLAARLCRRRVLCHVREAETKPARAVRAAVVAPLALAHVAVYNSRSTRSIVESDAVAKPARSVVVHNAKNWEPFFRNPPRPLGASPRLCVVGRLSHRKGQDVALRAVEILRNRGIPAHLRLVGGVFPGYEWYEAQLRRQAAALGVPCDIAGFRTDVAQCMDEADIILVPSRVEPFGTVALEALAAMRPVVASRVDGLGEILHHELDALLVEPDDPTGIADAVERLVRDPDLAERLCREGYKYVRERFTADAYAAQILAVVDEAKAASARTAPAE
jgi:hypothetical protein